MKEYQLKTRQICLFFIAFLPTIKFFMFPSVIANIAKEDLWLSALLNFFLDALVLCVLIKVCKKTDKTFFSLLELNYNKNIAKVVYALYSIYFFLKAILPICEQKDFIELTLYPTSATIINFIPFFIIAFYLSCKHLRIIGRASDVMWTITLIGSILLFSLAISNVDFGAFLPIGANGIKSVAKASYSAFNWFGDAVYLLFFIGEFKFSKKDGKKIMLSFGISVLITIMFIVIFYGTFTSIAFRQKFALTETSKYSTVINNIGRIDYLGIFFIMASNIFSTAMPLYFSNYTINKVINSKNNRVIPLVLTLLLFAVIIFLKEYFNSIEKLFINYAGWFFLLFGNVIPISTIFLTKKEKKIELT